MPIIQSTDNAELVSRAQAGDEQAWAEIVQRFQPLICKIVSSYRLGSHDAEDVAQMVWTKLVHHIDHLREPRALPGWISTTASRECLSLAKHRKRSVSTDPASLRATSETAVYQTIAEYGTAIDDDLMRAERRRAVRHSLIELTSTQQQLLLLLVEEPPVPYRKISEQIGIPMGSIGPTRARLLKRLGASAALEVVSDRSGQQAMAAA